MSAIDDIKEEIRKAAEAEKEEERLEREKKKARTSAATKAWYQRNKEELRVRENQRARQDRLTIIEQFGGKCSTCGEHDPIVLDFDHINDDRHLEREKGDTRRLEFIARENPSRFQLLCKNCNWRKEYWRRQDGS